MVRKSFRVTVCLDLHQVSCPGVWLCPKGKIFITVSLFKCLETTKQVKPVFPLKYHQRFIFDKIFDSVSSLGELEAEMASRNVRMELVQVFKGKLKMVTLGVFQAALTSVLYPAIASGSDCGAAEVDLLFEPCQPFPGIIAPKAEVSTRAVIEELRLCPKFTEGPVNPTLVSSTMKCGGGKSRQKTVCHNKPSADCTCCAGGVGAARPKTTGGTYPRANSRRCKGLPPPRPKTIEGGSESAMGSEVSDGPVERDARTSQNGNRPRPEQKRQSYSRQDYEDGTDDYRGQPSDRDEDLRMSVGGAPTSQQRDGRKSRDDHSSPEQRFTKQTVNVEVHARCSDSEIEIARNEGYEGSNSQGEENADEEQRRFVRPSIAPDNVQRGSFRRGGSQAEGVGSKTNYGPNGKRTTKTDTVVQEKGLDARGINLEPVGKGCDCFTCPQCRQTMDRLMVPWKVYAAPSSLEHCFCHNLGGRQANGREGNGTVRNEVQLQSRHMLPSQSVTTQTSGICRCQEPKVADLKRRSVEANDNKKTRKEENNSNPKVDTNQTMGGKDRQTRRVQNGQPDDNYNSSLQVKYLCPCGCIDMERKREPSGKTCGKVERRSQPALTVSHNRCQTCGNGLKSIEPKAVKDRYQSCVCFSNKNKCKA